MALIVVVGVCLDSSLLMMCNSAWKSAGYTFAPAGSIKEAIERFKAGDFDLELLGYSVPAESRERPTFLIRASGSRIPVVCIMDSSGDCNSFADATISNDPTNLLQIIRELMDKRAHMLAPNFAVPGMTT
jgi:CheY-like chemotaxis protein